ncbi:selenoprotein S [Brienomyrus brachyistius]|uniref:selenoprotein S n=1 Tax=Brienomyrus brachyistius TaxID=42636 RepID=UPI0020B40C26|nr:selenoprotein S [Brienomyrus brachyistius]
MRITVPTTPFRGLIFTIIVLYFFFELVTYEKVTTEAPLENQDLSFLMLPVGAFLAEYGWYLLFFSVGVFLLIQEFRKRGTNQPPSRSSLEIVNDAPSVVRRQEALDASRQRMQDELDAKAEQYKEKKQKAEEEKRKQKTIMWDSMKSGRSSKTSAEAADNNEGTSSSTEVKSKRSLKPLRSGYNPMTGEGGGSCSWRPGRRGPTSGG